LDFLEESPVACHDMPGAMFQDTPLPQPARIKLSSPDPIAPQEAAMSYPWKTRHQRRTARKPLLAKRPELPALLLIVLAVLAFIAAVLALVTR
jgi:hypothetical protein